MDLKYFIKTIWEGKGDAKEARVEIEKLGDAADKAAPKQKRQTDATSMMGGALTKLIATGVFLEAGRQVLKFGADSIAAASNVEEMQSKFNTVFAQEAPRVTSALDDFADAANRSKTELMGYAATLQDTFVPLGFARDEAADMSVQLVKLAEDLASFNNLNTDEVVRDLQSALVGNTETLRKYGVVAQETQIKQEAINSGLWDGVGILDAQTKAQAILQLTLKGTTDAQGDAIKTADSYANTQRGLEAATLDLKVAVGQGLMPTMTALTMMTTELVQQLSIAAKGFSGEYAQGVQAANEAGQAQVETFDEMAARLARVNEAYELSRSFLGRFTGTQDEARVALRDAIETLALGSDSYEEFTTAAKAAGLTTSDVANILNLFESDLHGNTEAWYETELATRRVTDAIKEGTIWRQEMQEAISAENSEMGAWAGRAAISIELYGQLYERVDEVTRGVGGFTGAITGSLSPLEELNTALTAQDAGMTAVAENAAYVETLNSMGANTDIQADKVANLTMKILGIPPAYSSKINVDTSAAESKINRLKDMLGSLGAARAVAPEVGDVGGGASAGPASDYDPLNRATGGPVLGGRPYVVGEGGPELFVPATSGRIDNGAGGIGGVTIEMDLRGAVIASQSQLQGWMQAAMAQAGRQTDVRMRT